MESRNVVKIIVKSRNVVKLLWNQEMLFDGGIKKCC